MCIPLLVNFANYLLGASPVVVEQPANSAPGHLELELRHIHATTSDSRIIFHDVPPSLAPSVHRVKTRSVTTTRPQSFAAHQHSRLNWYDSQVEPLVWLEDDVAAPDIESRETLLSLAKMTNNAYQKPSDKGWYDLGGEWNTSFPVGWEPDDDGFRGYVFATPDNSTIALAIKGTSLPIVGGGPTTRKDRLNDNLMFSCCCARVDWSWSTVCGCYRGGQRCDQGCLETALIEESLFYPIGTNLYNNITFLYPDSDIWLIGHSLGGALASLLGATFGAPVVAFEAPGERMAARRLHLPLPPSLSHITHVYNTADAIATGVCTGSTSSCGIAGYALESKCHLGQTLLYDTVANLSWGVGVTKHSIATVTDTLLAQPWLPAEEIGREVPIPISEEVCIDCGSWEYGDFPKDSLSLAAPIGCS